MTPAENSTSTVQAESDSSLDAADKLVLASPEEARSPRDFLLWAGVILLAVLTIFSKPVLQGAFIWDDDRYVSQNHDLRSTEGLGDIWTKFGLVNGGTIQYYPLTFTSFWIEYQIFGGGVWPPQPGSVFAIELHVTNLVLHALGAILLWFLLRQLGLPGSWLIAAIWAIHPLQTESVSWISERKNVLCGLFYFAAIWAYLRSGFGLGRSGFGLRVSGWGEDDSPTTTSPLPPEPRAPSPEIQDPFYWLAFALFICAMLSKTIACTMPAVVLVLLWWKRGRLSLKDILATLPFFAVGIGLSIFTSTIEHALPAAGGVGAVGPEWSLSLAEKILVAGRAVWFYAWKNLWPVNLAFIYPKWPIHPHLAWQWIFPVAVVIVLLALLLLRKWIGRGPFAAAAIFVGTLIPALGFVSFYPMRYSYVADHFQYLAGPALIALIVVILAKLLRRPLLRTPAVGYILAGCILIALAVMSVRRSAIYVGQLALWQDTVARNPSSWMAHYNYGLSLAFAAEDFAAGQRPDEAAATRLAALEQFRETVAIKPDHDRAWQGMGLVLLNEGKAAEAIDLFSRSLSINPDNLEAMMGRAAAYDHLKHYDEALAGYRQALDYAETHRQDVARVKAAAIYQAIGIELRAKGNLKAAADSLTRAANIAPGLISARLELAQVLNQLGDKPASAKVYADIIIDQPDNIDARLGLASLMLDVGNAQGAREQLIASARIDRDNKQLMVEAKRYHDLYEKQQAATRPSTTRAAPSPAPGSRP